ncbi:NADH-quinone oxidoreductase subunit C [Thermosipho globiformans]|uniref:NADH-quinone oxidoreductase subunit C n=1 Tax=Thermosipho globiformans TaxID=380685 RepID=UPI000F8ED197|nr:NADH-quinone oxidoreductase subunit C [Thermosipho globiformans]
MTNSMNDVINNVKNIASQVVINEIDEREIKLELNEKEVINVLSYLKGNGFSHLSLMTVVDWIDESKFEIVYILFSWKTGNKIIVSTKIDRKEAKFVTIKHLWPTARFYEREIHEFFGIEFKGNDDMKPLFLEIWDDIPPLRKDFDPLEYSKKKFPDREYEKDVIHEAKIIRGDING